VKIKHLRVLSRRAEYLKQRIKANNDYDKAELSALLAVLEYFNYKKEI
jgi:hypothetical protein